MAEGVFRELVTQQGLADRFVIDSAGTGSWHSGDPPHPEGIAVAHSHGIDIRGQRSRQVQPRDLHSYDWIVAMDASNVRNLRRIGAEEPSGFPLRSGVRVVRLLEYVKNAPLDVPDPYYEGGFESVFELIETGCRGLLLALTAEESSDA
jgi:protein-tyrosine phosphatase